MIVHIIHYNHSGREIDILVNVSLKRKCELPKMTAETERRERREEGRESERERVRERE